MSQIFIYCGEDIISSRRAFLDHLMDLKKENQEIERLSGKELSSDLLENILGSQTLFGEKRALAVESFFSGQKTKEKEEILDKISSFKDCLVLFWESKSFSRAEQQKYPKDFVFKNFSLPQVLFAFLDSLAPGKTALNLKSLKSTLEQTESPFVFLMLVRQFRLLLMAKSNKDLLKLAPWQKGKLKKQALCFEEKKLIEVLQKLLEIDFKQKTSAIPYSLEHLLEFLVTEI